MVMYKVLQEVESNGYFQQHRVGDQLKWYFVLGKVKGRIMGVKILFNLNIQDNECLEKINESELMAYVIELSDGKRVYTIFN